MEIWILVFVVVIVLKAIKIPTKSSGGTTMRRLRSRRRATGSRAHGLPWMDPNYKKAMKQKERMRNSNKFLT